MPPRFKLPTSKRFLSFLTDFYIVLHRLPLFSNYKSFKLCTTSRLLVNGFGEELFLCWLLRKLFVTAAGTLSIMEHKNNCIFSPSHTELFTLSQCSSSGRILTSSFRESGSSRGKVSSRRASGSCSCHVKRITKSTTSKPETMVYNFQGSTFFYGMNKSRR